MIYEENISGQTAEMCDIDHRYQMRIQGWGTASTQPPPFPYFVCKGWERLEKKGRNYHKCNFLSHSRHFYTTFGLSCQGKATGALEKRNWGKRGKLVITKFENFFNSGGGEAIPPPPPYLI